jgi:hypothetical protein
MKTLRIASRALIAVLLAAGPVVAHHGWSGDDASKEMTLDGVIPTTQDPQTPLKPCAHH